MYYPAVTLCKKSPFKIDILKKFNISYSILMTSSWKNFSFDEKTLADVYEEATYSFEEFFHSFSLDTNASNVKVVMSLQFSYGKCYTLIPLVTTKMPWIDSGYHIVLRHNKISKNALDSSRNGNPGWNMFLHMPIEDFTEYGISSSGRIENLFVDFDEKIELKISAHHYSFFVGRGSKCSTDHHKSSSMCYENCLWEYIENKVNCSGPWMKKGRKPFCSDPEAMNMMIVEYSKFIDGENVATCDCSNPCETSMYSSYIMNRKPVDEAGSSNIFIYYTSKMVTKLEEKSSYDSTQFLADMGGSLGFLLGLSVIGFIIILEKILGYLFLDQMVENYRKKKDEEEEISKKENECAKEAKILDM